MKGTVFQEPQMSKDEQAIEAEIQAKGLNAPRLSPEKIDAARVHLDEARGDPSYTLDDIEDLKAELHHLEREFSLTGVTSEYDL
jgi:hypothetical protein